MAATRKVQLGAIASRLLVSGVLAGLSSSFVQANEILRLSDQQLDSVSAGLAEQQVNAGATAAGALVPAVTLTVTTANAIAGAAPIPGTHVGGAAGGGGAVSCCTNAQTGITGSTNVPGPFGATLGQTQTGNASGLSITIGAFGGAGAGP